MKALTAPVAALAIATATALPASAQESPPTAAPEPAIASVLGTLQRVAVQYGILMLRSFVELTYDDIAIESGTGDVILSGLRVYPVLGEDPERACVVTIDGLRMADATSLETLGSAIALRGVTIPPACLPPPAAATLTAFGYDGVTVDHAAIDIDYHVPSSAAGLVVTGSVAGAADVTLSADFDYLWFRLPLGTPDDPEAAAASAVPVARLAGAELVVENRGLWQALEPMVAQQLGGDLSRAPQLVQGALTATLSEGGTRSLTPRETAFVRNLAAEVGRFVQDGDRIVLTAEPESGSVALTEALIEAPGALVAALNPLVSAVPAAYRRMIAPADLSAALAGGDGLDAATRLRVGEALITGVGAPRAVASGRQLLAPLADGWNAEAALLMARADRHAGDAKAAYTMALRAVAGGESAAISLADALEAELPLAGVLNLQSDASDQWPGAAEAAEADDELIATADISGMTVRARAAAVGRDRPRDYASAYYWASLAAAAGDRGAATLRDRLDARFEGQPGWAETAAAAQADVLETWVGGLAAGLVAGME